MGSPKKRQDIANNVVLVEEVEAETAEDVEVAKDVADTAEDVVDVVEVLMGYVTTVDAKDISLMTVSLTEGVHI